jgi:SAM-dependent methyltransferase
MKNDSDNRLFQALWKIYNRPSRPTAWAGNGNLPWNDPEFSRRMLREHLDQSHGAASRTMAERQLQLAWFREKLNIQPGRHILDVTCGPGLYAVDLAKEGCSVVGFDFGPVSIAYAHQLAQKEGVAANCKFIEQDVLQADFGENEFDAALFIYGQLAVFPQEQAQMLLEKVVRALRPGGRLCVELLNQDRLDKKDSNWWFTDDTSLWGDAPFLHLGERFWDDEQEMSLERFQTIHLGTGQLDEVILCDQSYSVEMMVEMMRTAGFIQVDVFPAWDDVPLYDKDEWIVYIARMPKSFPS